MSGQAIPVSYAEMDISSPVEDLSSEVLEAEVVESAPVADDLLASMYLLQDELKKYIARLEEGLNV